MAEENIMTKQSVGWLEMTNYTSDPFPGGKSTRRGLAFINGSLYYWSGTDFVALGTASGGVTTFDDLYDNDKTLTLDDGVLTFTVSTAANGIYINKTNTGAGVPLVIGNSGSGYDVQGPSWSIISTGNVGILELTSGGTINATGGALTIGATGTATTFAGTVTINEGLSTADGAVTFTDNSNVAASVSIVNATVTTYAGVFKVTAAALTSGTGILATFASMTSGLGLSIVAAATTTGTLLKLTATEATLTTGKYIDCYDGAATDFSVARYGAVTIAGLGANNMLTITAGDVVMSDGSCTITDADNAASLSVTNNTATTASVLVFAGSGTFTGNTTGSFATITPSGLTTGTGVYLPLAALTTGKGLHITSGATQTTGSLLYVQDTGANCAITSGTVASFDLTATAITGTVNKIGAGVSVTSSRTTTTGTVSDDFDLMSIVRTDIINGAGSMAAAGSVLYIENAVTNTSGTVTDTVNGIEVVMDTLGTGDGVKITHAATGGKALNIIGAATSVSDVLITGSGVKADNKGVLEVAGSGAIAAGGAVLRVVGTGTPAAATSYLVDLDASGRTMTNNPIAVQISSGTSTGAALNIVSTATTITGGILNLSMANATTGVGVNIGDANALTTGSMVKLVSNSADTTARSLVYLKNDNAAAVGAIPLETVNDAVTGTGNKFTSQAKFGGFTLWVSIDGTSPDGVLTGTAGDICLNCDATSHKMMVCTGTTNWAAVTG